jgi:hypothetical protein
MSQTVLKRSDYETVNVSCFKHAMAMLVHNIDENTMRVKSTTFVHDDTVQKSLYEIQSRGLVAIPVFEYPVEKSVSKDGAYTSILRMSDLLLSNDGKDVIVGTPITWVESAPEYTGDGITPLRFGTVSECWRQMIVNGTLLVL